MRYQVPQFIEIESKIFGPLTVKQFVYLVGGAGLIFLLYVVLPFWLMILFSLPIGAFSITLAFYKLNKQPFIKVVENAIRHFSSPRLYLWKKSQKKTIIKEIETTKAASQIYVPKLTRSKLKDLSWSLDIKDILKQQ